MRGVADVNDNVSTAAGMVRAGGRPNALLDDLKPATTSWALLVGAVMHELVVLAVVIWVGRRQRRRSAARAPGSPPAAR